MLTKTTDPPTLATPLVAALVAVADAIERLDGAILNVLGDRADAVPLELREAAATALDKLAAIEPTVQPTMGGGTWMHNLDRTPEILARLIRQGCIVEELGYLAEGFRRLAREEENLQPSQRQIDVAAAHWDLIRAIKRGAGHSKRSTPAVTPCVEAGLLELNELDLAVVTPVGARALAFVLAKRKSQP